MQAAKAAIILSVLLAAGFAGCLEGPFANAKTGKALKDGGFFLRVAAVENGLAPTWQSITMDFTNARLFRDIQGKGRLDLVPNVAGDGRVRWRDVDLVQAARANDVVTVAYIYHKNEFFTGFSVDMVDIHGVKKDDPVRGEVGFLEQSFEPAEARLAMLQELGILAATDYTRIVEVIIIFDLKKSLDYSLDGTPKFTPRYDRIVIKVDNQLFAELGKPKPQNPGYVRARFETFRPPVAVPMVYANGTRVAWERQPVHSMLRNPLNLTWPVGFSSGASRDPDELGKVVRHVWDLGDGTPLREGVVQWHNYTRGGLYDVRLRVADDDDMVDEATVVLLVTYGFEDVEGTQTRSTEGVVVNARDHEGKPVENVTAVNVSLVFPPVPADEKPFRPGFYEVVLTWEGVAAPGEEVDLDLELLRSGRVHALGNATGPGPERVFVWGKPYVKPELEARVIIKSGLEARFNLTATAHYVPDIEAGWDGHAGHDHPRYIGLFRQ